MCEIKQVYVTDFWIKGFNDKENYQAQKEK